MPRVTSSIKLVRNTLTNGLGGVIGTALGILLTPFLIREMGLEAYGVWTLALTLSFTGGYAALSDLGVETATVRFLAEAWADDAREEFNTIAATSFAFFAALGAVIAVVVVVMAWTLTDLFSVQGSLRGAAHTAFVLIGLQLTLELPGRALAAVLEGTQHFVAYQSGELARASVFAAGAVVVLSVGGGLADVAACYAGAALVGFALYWVMAHRAVPGLRMRPTGASRAELRRMLGFGLSVFSLRVVGTLYRQMDKVILGIATQPALVGLYEIANKLHLLAAQVQSLAVSALTPATAQSRRDNAVLQDMFVRGTLYSSAVAVPVAVGAMIFAEPLLTDWIGSDARGAVGPARILLAYLLTTAFLGVGQTMLVALGKSRRVVQISVASLIVNLGLSIALVGPLDINGVVLGTLIAGLLCWLPLVRLCLREIEVRPAAWTRHAIVPHVPGVVAQCAVGLPLLALINGAGSLALDALAVLVSIAANVFALVFLGLGRYDRAILISTARASLSGSTTPPLGEAPEMPL